MRRYGVFALAALLGAGCSHKRAVVDHTAAARVATTADELFSLALVPELALTLDPSARKALTEHPSAYVAASLAYGGKTYPVKLKLKGNRSFRPLDGKPALRLRFDKAGKHGRFLGLRGLVLNNMVDDPTGLHEILAYQLYRAAGVPAPRAAYAKLTLDGVAYGVYLMVEPIDESFLERTLGKPAGPLFEGEYGCDVFPEDNPTIELKHGGPEARVALAALSKQAAEAPHQLVAGPGSLIDVPEVVSFLATATVLGDFDGYWHSHNYYLTRGTDGKWRIIPWGVDRVFMDRMPIYGSQGRLAILCFADRDCRAAYARRLLEVTDLFEQLEPKRTMAKVYELVSDALDLDLKAQASPADRQARRREMLDYVRTRPDEVRGQVTCLDHGRELDRDGDGAGCLDCDDRDPAIHPGAAEICDGKDNDCDGLVDDDPSCGCQRIAVGDAKFELCDLPMPWQQAQTFCARKGMALARIDDAAQTAALSQAALARRNDRWWLGLSDRAVADHYAWVDGQPLGFSQWAEGEPQTFRCEQDCAVLDDFRPGVWALGDCALYQPFVCRVGERDAELLPAPAPKR